MTDRPYVLLCCAMSVDGYIDDSSPERLLLSNDEDFDRVDAVRAGSDAILVGANTIRRDDPRLLVRSTVRQSERQAKGMSPQPIKVTLTSSGDLDPHSRFFAAGDTLKIVYCSASAVNKLRKGLGDLANLVEVGDPVDLSQVLTDLAARGVRRLMVEGGGSIHTQFLTSGLANEIQLVVAPFFVGDSKAPRFAGDGRFPFDSTRRMKLAEVNQIGDVVLLRYLLNTRSSR